MRVRRTTAFMGIGALVVALLFAVDGRQARADSYVIAGPGSVAAGYYTPVMVLPKGQKAFFLNLDVAAHDVVSRPAGKFKSAIIPTGRQALIQGANQTQGRQPRVLLLAPPEHDRHAHRRVRR